MSDQQ